MGIPVMDQLLKDIEANDKREKNLNLKPGS